jgi:micrococcal nuclease
MADFIKKLGISNNAFIILLGLVAASGASYGGYTIYKDNMRTDYQETKPVYMSEVLDGDTFIIDTGERIRLSDIDAPEKTECFGHESTVALENILQGKQLRIVKDMEGSDNFGRLIRYVTILNDNPTEDNILVNDYMAANGYARYSANKNSMHQKEIIKSEGIARVKKAGMWGQCADAITEKDGTPKRVMEANIPPSDPKCLIKGNVSDLGYGKKYILPHCANYNLTKIDPSKGEKYFCTEEDAKKEGFTIIDGCVSR